MAKDYIIDAKNKKLGRLASEIAVVLQGKNKAEYDPRLSGDVKVIVKNIKDIELTGDKKRSKVYYSHSGKLGHLKETSYEKVFDRDPGEVLRRSVMAMLPKNKLRKQRIKRLIVEENA